MDRGMIVVEELRGTDATNMKFQVIAMMLAGAMTVANAPAWAVPPRSVPRPAHPATLEQAVKQVQQQTHGHILAADTVSRGRTNVYRIKVLTPKGKVQVMQLHSNPQPQGHSNKTRSDQGGH
jgi:hypothetical protein